GVLRWNRAVRYHLVHHCAAAAELRRQHGACAGGAREEDPTPAQVVVGERGEESLGPVVVRDDGGTEEAAAALGGGLGTDRRAARGGELADVPGLRGEAIEEHAHAARAREDDPVGAARGAPPRPPRGLTRQPPGR